MISRPNGIFPGAKVFQLPPPAVDASAVSPAAVGIGEAAMLGGGDTDAAAGGGDATATAGRDGVAALATWIGVAEGAVFCATTVAGDAAAVGAGVGLPLASFPRFPAGDALALAGGGDACATWIGSTGFACSTRTNAFAGGGVDAAVMPAIGTCPPGAVSERR